MSEASILRASMLDALYAAAGSPHGHSVRSNDPARLRGRLYLLRTELMDPGLTDLTFNLVVPGELWIARKRREATAPQGTVGALTL